MKRISIFYILLFALLPNIRISGQNLLNGNFELWPPGCPVNTPPTNWQNFSSPPAQGPDQVGTCHGPTTSFQGNSHMNIVWTQGPTGMREGLQQTVSGLVPGQTYSFSFFAINDNNYSSTGTGVLEVYVDNVLHFTTTPLTWGGPWAFFSTSFSAASASAIIGLKVNEVSGSSGSVGVDSVLLGQTCMLSADIHSSVQDSFCLGQNIQFLPILTGQTNPCTYSWSGPNSFSSSQLNPVVSLISFADSGWYRLTVTDSSGCVASDSVRITIMGLPSVTANASVMAVCAGDPVTLSGGGATSYSWNPGVMNGVAFSPTVTTTYTVTGTDNNNCSDTASVTIAVNPLPVVTIDFSEIDTLCLEQGIVNLTGANPGGGTFSGTGVTGSTFDPSAAGLGTFTVTYTFTDTNNCSDSATTSIFVDICNGTNPVAAKDLFLVYPNPCNGEFTISSSTQMAEISISNLFGQVIFSTAVTREITTFQIENNGIYIVTVSTKQGVSAQKLIVSK